MTKEYGGREDGLVKEEYNYQYGKMEGVQILWYDDGLRVEKTYKNGKIEKGIWENGKFQYAEGSQNP